MNTVEQFYAWARRRATEAFNNSGYHPPLFSLQIPGGEILQVVAPWRNNEEQDLAIAKIREACRAACVQRVAIVTEGWLREEGERGRSEILLINIQSSIKGEKNRVGFFRIKRDAGGKATVGEWCPMDGPGHSHTSVYDDLVTANLMH